MPSTLPDEGPPDPQPVERAAFVPRDRRGDGEAEQQNGAGDELLVDQGEHRRSEHAEAEADAALGDGADDHRAQGR